MKYFNVLVSCLFTISVGCSQHPVKFNIQGKITFNGKGVYGATISVFENDALKNYQDSKICYSINEKGYYSCPLNYLATFGESHVFHMVFEHPDYITTVCDVTVRKGDKMATAPDIELIKSANTSNQGNVQLLVYDTKDLSKQSEKILEIERGKNLLFSVQEDGKIDTSILFDNGELYRAKGIWLKLIYTKDFVNFKSTYVFYNKDKNYKDAYQCYQAYLQPIKVCNLYETPQLAKLGKPSKLQIDASTECKVNGTLYIDATRYLSVIFNEKEYFLKDNRNTLALNGYKHCQDIEGQRKK